MYKTIKRIKSRSDNREELIDIDVMRSQHGAAFKDAEFRTGQWLKPLIEYQGDTIIRSSSCVLLQHVSTRLSGGSRNLDGVDLNLVA